MKLKSYGISLGISYVIATILICIVATIFAYTNINDSTLNIFTFAIVIFTSLTGSIINMRRLKTKGLLNGCIFGLIFFAIFYLISSLISGNFAFNTSVLIYTALSIFSGMVGGIIGVNM